jgi:hypothetical protein
MEQKHPEALLGLMKRGVLDARFASQRAPLTPSSAATNKCIRLLKMHVPDANSAYPFAL